MHILVVDDHPLFLKGVEFLLDTHHPDYITHPVHDAVQALELLDRQSIDLIILDLNLPGIDGEAFLKAVNERNLRIPTLAMSAELDGNKILAALNNGALGFVSKSFEPQEMLRAIDTVARNQLFVPSSVVPHLERAKRVRRTSGQGDSKAHDHGITPRQLAVLRLMAQGRSNKEIATSLSLTEYTVKSHVRALFNALESRNRTACVQTAQSLGIVGFNHPTA